MFLRSALLCVGIAARQGAAHVGGNIPPSWWECVTIPRGTIHSSCSTLTLGR